MDDEDEAWHPRPRSKRRRRDNGAVPPSNEQIDSETGNVVFSTRETSFTGESEANPLIILSDDETELMLVQKSKVPGSVSLDIACDYVRFQVDRALIGALCFIHGSDAGATVTFTNSQLSLTLSHQRTATLCLKRKRQKRVFQHIAINSGLAPFFLAMRPSAKLEEDWTHEAFNPRSKAPSPGDFDYRYIVLYMKDAAELQQIVRAIQLICPELKKAFREVRDEDVSAIDRITKRQIRNRTRAATRRSRLLRSCASPTQTRREAFLEYPIEAKKRIPVYLEEIEALEPGEFLNDTIIDFYLRYLQETIDIPRLHMFSSFFYKRFVGTDRSLHYDAVRKWTRDVDIFAKDFLVVPVCANMHWFAVIVCFSGMPAEEATERRFPCLLLLDSLDASGANRQLFRIMRKYLSSEWHARKHTPRSFNGQTMPGFVLKVPAQTNNCDCGVFLLQYVESFLQDIPTDFRRNELHRPEWFPISKVAEKRQHIRSLLMTLHNDWQTSLERRPLRLSTPPPVVGLDVDDDDDDDDGDGDDGDVIEREEEEEKDVEPDESRAEAPVLTPVQECATQLGNQ